MMAAKTDKVKDKTKDTKKAAPVATLRQRIIDAKTVADLKAILLEMIA